MKRVISKLLKTLVDLIQMKNTSNQGPKDMKILNRF